mmetsp:Transcript_18453/g.37710  ORF Transcript_18453/g.37710 Transcript_18453/m.37710 type:complete len:222 (+) Transcript_18453:280-945(+)
MFLEVSSAAGLVLTPDYLAPVDDAAQVVPLLSILLLPLHSNAVLSSLVHLHARRLPRLVSAPVDAASLEDASPLVPLLPVALPLLGKNVVLPCLVRLHDSRCPLERTPVNHAHREDVSPLVPLLPVLRLVPVRLEAVLGHPVALHVRRHPRLVHAPVYPAHSNYPTPLVPPKIRLLATIHGDRRRQFLEVLRVLDVLRLLLVFHVLPLLNRAGGGAAVPRR